MMIEVPIKVREKEYTTKDGEKRTSKEIKFWDLGLEQYVVVEKLYDEPRTYEGNKDGKAWKINKTLVNYNGEKVSVNISESSLERWNSLPLGKIEVSKMEHEGKMGTFTTYNFDIAKLTPEEVAEKTGGKVEECPF